MKAGTNTSGKSPEDINSPKGRRRTVPPNTEYGQEERDGNRDNSSMNDSHTMSSFMTNVDKRWRTITKTVRLYFRSYKLVKFSEWFISVDQSFYWRRSLVWSQDDGVKLKTHITGKYSSMSVLSTLLLSSEVSVLFSPSDVLTEIRINALDGPRWSLDFLIVFFLSSSVLLTLCTILATFTAWSTVSSVSERNIHCITRSAIGLYTTQLPTSLLTFSLITFLTWVIMLLFRILPPPLPTVITSLTVAFAIHMVTTFSIFGRIILHSNAMSDIGIFPRSLEEGLMPVPLYERLLEKTDDNRHIPVSVQYRRNLREAIRKGEDETVIERHKRRHTYAGGGEGTETKDWGEAAWEVREGTERSTGDVTPRVAVKGTEELFRRKGGSEGKTMEHVPNKIEMKEWVENAFSGLEFDQTPRGQVPRRERSKESERGGFWRNGKIQDGGGI